MQRHKNKDATAAAAAAAANAAFTCRIKMPRQFCAINRIASPIQTAPTRPRRVATHLHFDLIKTVGGCIKRVGGAAHSAGRCRRRLLLLAACGCRPSAAAAVAAAADASLSLPISLRVELREAGKLKFMWKFHGTSAAVFHLDTAMLVAHNLVKEIYRGQNSGKWARQLICGHGKRAATQDKKKSTKMKISRGENRACKQLRFKAQVH